MKISKIYCFGSKASKKSITDQKSETCPDYTLSNCLLITYNNSMPKKKAEFDTDIHRLNSAMVKELAADLGADQVGITAVSPVTRKTEYLKWLSKGYDADMSYLSRHQPARFDPGNLLPGAQSIIVVGLNYNPRKEDLARCKAPYKIARYAWGEDYHGVIRRLLRRLRSKLRSENQNLAGRICVDTAPFMDKYWARTAGIGWQGKHTNLISRQFGNWLVLGSLITNAEFDQYDKSHRNHCGKCTACIEACPTGAIIKPYILNANLCISYWTIESKADKIPPEISRQFDAMVFGCDLCLFACPFNRFEKPHKEEAFSRFGDLDLIESGKLKGLSPEKFKEKFSRSAVNRPGLAGLIRNIKAQTKQTESKTGSHLW